MGYICIYGMGVGKGHLGEKWLSADWCGNGGYMYEKYNKSIVKL